MNIGITGATGFVGRRIAALARQEGHRVTAFSRKPRPDSASFDEVRDFADPEASDYSGLDALIHLAGESIAGLWTKSKKEAIRRSRVEATQALVRRLRETPTPPQVLVTASGVAFYGDQGSATLTEASPGGSGFLAEVSQAWEAAAADAAGFMRVACLRTALALGSGGGAGKVLGPVFRAGLGGRLGSGRQWMPWIHVDDLARLYLFVCTHDSIRGPVNATAPDPVTNREFTAAAAEALHRPAFLTVPGFALRLLPGGMEEMFLQSQRVLPAAAREAGFQWEHPDLRAAAAETLGKKH